MDKMEKSISENAQHTKEIHEYLQVKLERDNNEIKFEYKMEALIKENQRLQWEIDQAKYKKLEKKEEPKEGDPEENDEEVKRKIKIL